MTDYHYLARGQAVVLDLPAPVRRDMPVRHFTLDRIEGREALLRAGQPVAPDHAAGRVGELAPARLVIDLLRHSANIALTY